MPEIGRTGCRFYGRDVNNSLLVGLVAMGFLVLIAVFCLPDFALKVMGRRGFFWSSGSTLNFKVRGSLGPKSDAMTTSIGSQTP